MVARAYNPISRRWSNDSLRSSRKARATQQISAAWPTKSGPVSNLWKKNKMIKYSPYISKQSTNICDNCKHSWYLLYLDSIWLSQCSSSSSQRWWWIVFSIQRNLSGWDETMLLFLCAGAHSCFGEGKAKCVMYVLQCFSL